METIPSSFMKYGKKEAAASRFINRQSGSTKKLLYSDFQSIFTALDPASLSPFSISIYLQRTLRSFCQT